MRRTPALATRDAFLIAVARGLEVRVAAACAVAKRARRKAAARAELATRLAALGDFATELRIIAEPRRRIAVHATRFELTKHLASLVLVQRERLAAHGLGLQVTRAGSILGRWDASHVKRIFLELVGNALKYGAGHPVTVQLCVAGGRAKHAVLSFQNHGAWRGGPLAGARFHRGTSAGAVKGYGIGVWLSRRVAQAMGGGLRVVRGRDTTTVAVSLPFERAGGAARFVATIGPAAGEVTPAASPPPRRPRARA